MTEDFVDCEETVGKTISSLRIYRDQGDGTEIQIDFSDGASFTCTFNSKPTFEANLVQAGPTEPVILKRYHDR